MKALREVDVTVAQPALPQLADRRNIVRGTDIKSESMASFTGIAESQKSPKAIVAAKASNSITEVVPDKPFRFLDLPAELRNYFYDVILSLEQPMRHVPLRQTWNLKPLQLYSNRQFIGLTQVNRTIRKEFSPHKYHTSYIPTITFYQLSAFLAAYPSLDTLDIDVPAMLDDLKAPMISSSIDVLPLTEIDWEAQPFKIRWLEPNFKTDRAVFVASCIASASSAYGTPEDWDTLKAISVSRSTSLVTVDFVWAPLDGVKLERVMDCRKAFVYGIIRETGILKQNGIRIQSTCGPFSFSASNSVLGYGRVARGRWFKGGRPSGPEESYYGFLSQALF